MVRRVKDIKRARHLDSNLTPTILCDLIALKEEKGHSTIAITDDGTSNGRLLGLVSSRDWRPSRTSPDTLLKDIMTPFESLIYGFEGITLSEANDMIWDNKLNTLPIIDKDRKLKYLVFRKDYESHKKHPLELLDKKKRYLVGAGINTRDFQQRVPALVDAGADVLCIDSSEGHTEWQKITLDWIRSTYGETVKVGAGNVDRKDSAFWRSAARLRKGGHRRRIDLHHQGNERHRSPGIRADRSRQARDEYFEDRHLCPDLQRRGIVFDYHMTLALAMGADF